MKLTPSAVAALTLPDGIDDKIFFDDDLKGLGVRLRRSGSRSLVLQYAIAGKTRKVPLGPAKTAADLAKARAQARDLLAKIRLGGDPASEKAQARVRSAETFGSLVKPFLLYQRDKPKNPLKPRSLKESERHLFKLCKPLHALPITAISRRTIAERLEEIARDNGPAASNRALGTLGAFFTWAIRKGMLDTNPASLIDKAKENRSRDRVLTDAELATVWQVLGEGRYGTIVKLLALTGLRRGEIGDLCWSEIDFETDMITVPAARTKNGREHLVPMSAPVRVLLEAHPRLEGRERVFATVLWNVEKKALDERVAETVGKPLAGWVLHDLRRVFSTRLNEALGVASHVVEVLLGHAGTHRAGVAGIYNRSEYLDERAVALDRWAAYVMSAVGEPKSAQVIQLKRTA